MVLNGLPSEILVHEVLLVDVLTPLDVKHREEGLTQERADRLPSFGV